MRPVGCKDRCLQTSPSRYFPANPYSKRLVLPPVLVVVFEVFFGLSKPRSAPFQILKIFESVQPDPPKNNNNKVEKNDIEIRATFESPER